jgi:hypothetical protein
MIVEIPGADADFYDTVMEALDWENAEKPSGFVSHYAGPGPNGWYVFDVWESEADWKKFAEERLGSALGAAAGGDPPAVEPTFIPLHFQDHAS